MIRIPCIFKWNQRSGNGYNSKRDIVRVPKNPKVTRGSCTCFWSDDWLELGSRHRLLVNFSRHFRDCYRLFDWGNRRHPDRAYIRRTRFCDAESRWGTHLYFSSIRRSMVICMYLGSAILLHQCLRVWGSSSPKSNRLLGSRFKTRHALVRT